MTGPEPHDAPPDRRNEPPAAAPPDGSAGYAAPPPGYTAPGYEPAPPFPAAPAYPEQSAAVPVAPPPPLALAVRLMYVGAVLSVLSALLGVVQRGAIRDQIAGRGGLNPSAIDAAVTAALVLSVVVGLLAAGLWVLNAVFNARGQAWARILSTVLGGLAVLFTLTSLAQPAPVLSRLLSIVQLVLAAAILVLLWRPESSRYYQARSGRAVVGG